MVHWTGSRGLWFVLLTVLAVLPYWRSLSYPFISDDYIQIRLGRELGDPENWSALLQDSLYRCRATSLYLTAATERLFGLMPAAFNSSSVLLHVLNTWLVLLLFLALRVGLLAAVAGASFFAVYEGHQEAVVWYAACPELLVLAFSLGAVLCWLRWRDSTANGGCWCAASLVLLMLAFFSKESSAAVPLVLVLVDRWRGQHSWKSTLTAAAPAAALAAIYAGFILAARDRHQFFFDGTFSLTPQFLLVLPHSAGRMLLYWGLLAAGVVGRCRILWFSIAWMSVTLVPYSFLTYMTRVPSRHTYFASVGLSLLIGAALAMLAQKFRARRPWLVPALATLVILHNCAYIWIRKHDQFLERAAPTEQLIEHFRVHKGYRGPVWVINFPYDKYVVECAASVVGRDPSTLFVSDDPPAGPVHTLRWDHDRKQLISN